MGYMQELKARTNKINVYLRPETHEALKQLDINNPNGPKAGFPTGLILDELVAQGKLKEIYKAARHRLHGDI